MDIKKNISLEGYTTMRLPGSAQYLVRVKSREDLLEAVSFSKKENLPFFILGGGSNIIFPEHYKGVVIKMEMIDFSIEEDDKFINISADAGVSLVLLSRKVTEMGGVGMEWGAGVPGSIGGAVRGNAGAFGNSTADFVTSVEVLNTEKMEIYSLQDFSFAYRESIFKKERDLIILSVKMQIPKGEGGVEKMKELLSLRREKHPHQPSAGSVFKNVGEKSVALLIEQCGLKGTEKGGAQISEKHANFIINKGGATREDVDYLIDLIKRRVKEKFNLDIEEEVDRNIK